MSKPLPERERQRLIKLIRSGKIELDNNIYLFTIDGVVIQMRGDMIPMSDSASEETANGW